jgi:CHASE3 domain sensor protein
MVSRNQDWRGFVLWLVFLSVIGATAYRSTHSFLALSDLTIHTYHVLDRFEHMFSSLMDAETGQRGYIITGEESYLEPYSAELKSLETAIDDLRKLTANNPSQQRRLDAIATLMK